MATAAKWAAALVVVAAAGVAVERSLGGGEPARPQGHRAVETPREETVLAAGETLDAPPAADASGERVAVPSPREAAARAELAAPAEATFEGRVVDLAGRPVAGANVVLLDDLEAAPTQAQLASEPGAEVASEVDGNRISVTGRRHAVTDTAGRFDLPVESGYSRLHARAPGLATVVAPALSWMPPPAMPIVVLGPERHYAGRVVDTDGNGLAGVKLWIRLPQQAAGTTDAMAWNAGPFVFASTAEDGTFHLPPAGFVPRMTLVAGSIAGFAPPLALPDADALDLVLAVGTARDGLLAGRVVDALGVGIADAYVSAGEFRWDSYAVTTDGDGAFVLPPASSGADFVRAAAAGRLPARVSLEGLDRDQRAALVLVLDGTPLSTAGHVLDAAGDPVPGALVWALDTERFGNAVEMSGAGLFMLRETTTERLLSGDGPGAGLAAVADAEGRFQLRGLLDREYRVAVMDARTLGTVLDLPLRAGRTDAILRLAPTERIVAVAGRVTNFAGEPLAGANVQSRRHFRGSDGRVTQPAHAPGATYPSTRTDAEGRFRFDALAVEDVMLHVSAADAGSRSVELAHEHALEALEVRVPATCYLRLHPTTGDGNRFSLVDARGEHVPSSVVWGGGTIGGESVRFSMSFDGLVRTDERAAALVLLREEVEVRRIPLAVRAGETLDVDL